MNSRAFPSRLEYFPFLKFLSITLHFPNLAIIIYIDFRLFKLGFPLNLNFIT
jgi:hypothetical protein